MLAVCLFIVGLALQAIIEERRVRALTRCRMTSLDAAVLQQWMRLFSYTRGSCTLRCAVTSYLRTGRQLRELPVAVLLCAVPAAVVHL